MRWVPRIIPWTLALAAALCAAFWWRTGAASVNLRLPGADRPPGMAAAPAVDLAGAVILGTGKPPATLRPEPFGSWPQFRGSGTGRSAESKLLKDISQAKKVWEIEVGEGYAGPAIREGRLYFLDYADGADALRCLNSQTGEELWRHTYKVDVKRNHGMSRTIPAVDENVVITLGPQCHVVACSTQDGRFLWGKDLVRDFGTKVPPWYAGQCPLLKDGKVYLAPAGPKVLLTALDAKTGDVLWETPNDPQWKMTHSSLQEMKLDGGGGITTLVYCGSKGVIGVEEATGKILWQSPDWKVSIATVPSPVDLGDNRILFTGGYGAGAMIGRVVKNDDAYKLQVEKRMGPGALGSEQQTPVILPDASAFLAVIPSGEMVCMSLDGTLKWRSGANRFGSGPYLVADGAAYVLNDTGTLTALAADSGGYKVLGTNKVYTDGRECWGPMALSDGRLYGRDLTRLFCLDLRAK